MGEGPPPNWLVLARRGREYGKLPEDGGLRDQLAGDLERMAAAYNVFHSVLSWKSMFYGSGDIGTWTAHHQAEWKITQEWMRIRDE